MNNAMNVNKNFWFAEFSHETNKVIGWVRMHSTSQEYWDRFKDSAQRLAVTFQNHNIDVSADEIHDAFVEFLFPVVLAWIDDEQVSRNNAVDNAYMTIINNIFNN